MVQAFAVHALDYLTKPIEPERLQATLVRVRERIASQAALMTLTLTRGSSVTLSR